MVAGRLSGFEIEVNLPVFVRSYSAVGSSLSLLAFRVALIKGTSLAAGTLGFGTHSGIIVPGLYGITGPD